MAPLAAAAAPATADACQKSSDMDATDIAALVSDFLADESRVSLKLPRLTTGQRKVARKLTEQHTELVCQSFGFSADRRLHLFKKGRVPPALDGSPRTPLSLASTSASPSRISRFELAGPLLEDPEHEEEEKVSTLTTSGDLSERSTCSASASEGSSSSAAGRQGRAKSVPEVIVAADAEQEVAERSRRVAEWAQGLPELPVEHEELPMKNTFIHFRPETDDRVVQSMPHGMFGQRFQAEMDAAALAVEEPHPEEAAAVERDDEKSQPLSSTSQALVAMLAEVNARAQARAAASVDCALVAVGSTVVVDGLSKHPAFNGLAGVVHAYSEETGRYSVLLTSNAGFQWAQVRGENLRPVAAVPALYGVPSVAAVTAGVCVLAPPSPAAAVALASAGVAAGGGGETPLATTSPKRFGLPHSSSSAR